MNSLSTNRLAGLRWRASSLALLTILAHFAFYRWSPLAYGANLGQSRANRSAMTRQQASVTRMPVQSATALTPQLFYPAVSYAYNDGLRTWNATLTVQNPSATNSASVQMVFYHQNGQSTTPSSLPTTGAPLPNPFRGCFKTYQVWSGDAPF